MSILVGTKGELALECISSNNELKQGYLFMYIHGQRYGEDSFDFDVDAMIQNTVGYFQTFGLDLPGLLECPVKELFDSFNMVSPFDIEEDDINELGDVPAIKYQANFVENFLEIDNCIFRYICYAFDQYIILTIPAGDSLRVCIRDESNDEYEDVTLPAKDFFSLWKELAKRRGLPSIEMRFTLG